MRGAWIDRHLDDVTQTFSKLVVTSADIDLLFARSRPTSHLSTRPITPRTSALLESRTGSPQRMIRPRTPPLRPKRVAKRDLVRYRSAPKHTSVRQETVALRDFKPPYVALGSNPDFLLGRPRTAAQLGTRGGKVEEQGKGRAARANGKLGGRPKKAKATMLRRAKMRAKKSTHGDSTSCSRRRWMTDATAICGRLTLGSAFIERTLPKKGPLDLLRL